MNPYFEAFVNPSDGVQSDSEYLRTVKGFFNHRDLV